MTDCISNLPLAPLKGLLAYQPPQTTPVHEWKTCNMIDCIMCSNYDVLTTAILAVPNTPCNNYHCVYILHHPGTHEQEHVYIDITSVQKKETTNIDKIAEHLTKAGIRNHCIILSLVS